jgi:hypothetical protein
MTVTATVTAEPAPEDSKQAATPPDDGKLAVGQQALHAAGSMRLITVKDPVPGEQYDTPSPGMRFVAIQLEQCSDAGDTSTFVGEWFFLDRKGGEYSSVRTMYGWPTPEFPQFVELRSGQCKKGWMALELKKGIRFSSVVYRAAGTGESVAEWRL